jgi:hypothetical protein
VARVVGVDLSLVGGAIVGDVKARIGGLQQKEEGVEEMEESHWVRSRKY